MVVKLDFASEKQASPYKSTRGVENVHFYLRPLIEVHRVPVEKVFEKETAIQFAMVNLYSDRLTTLRAVLADVAPC